MKMGKVIWSPLHERYLRRYFPYLPTKLIAKKLNRNMSSVSMKAYQMKLSKKFATVGGNAWPPLFDRYIRRYYADGDTNLMAAKIGRYAHLIRSRANLMGIKKQGLKTKATRVKAVKTPLFETLPYRYIRRFYPGGSTAKIAERLGMKRRDVCARAYQMGVGKNKKPVTAEPVIVPRIKKPVTLPAAEIPVVKVLFVQPVKIMPEKKPYEPRYSEKYYPDDAFSLEVKALQGLDFELDKRQYEIQEVYYSNFRYVLQTNKRSFVWDRAQMEKFMNEIKLIQSNEV